MPTWTHPLAATLTTALVSSCASPAVPPDAASASPSASTTAAPTSAPRSAFEDAMDRMGGATFLDGPFDGLGADKIAVVAPKGTVEAIWARKTDATLERFVAAPLASKLVGATKLRDDQGERTVLVFESLAAAGQPAGVRGVLELVPDGYDEFVARAARAVAFEKATPEEISKYDGLTKAPSPAIAAALATMLDTKRLWEALPNGMDLFELAQGMYLAKIDRVDNTRMNHEDFTAMAHAVITAQKLNACVDLVCAAETPRGAAPVAVVFEPVAAGAKEAKIRGFIGLHLPSLSKPPATGKAAVVKATEDTTTTKAVLASRALGPVRILAQAPLTASGGTVAVAIPEATPLSPLLVFTEGGVEAALPIDSFDITAYTPIDGGTPPPPSYDVRFIDVDGDGRTEVVLRRRSPYDATSERVMTELVRVPGMVAPQRVRAGRGLEAQPELARAKSLDDALASLLAADWTPFTQADACAALGKGTTKQGMAAVVRSDAVLLEFSEPFQPSYQALDAVKPLAIQPPLLEVKCEELEWEGDHGVHKDGPGSTWYWLRRAEGALKVTGMAGYIGS